MFLRAPSNKSAVARTPKDLVILGRVVSAYGIKGWIKLHPFSVHANVLRTAKQWWLKYPVHQNSQAIDENFSMQVQRVRSQGSDLVAQLDQLNDRAKAEMLQGCLISVSRELFPKEATDEFYWVDLVGCDVYGLDENKQSTLIGVVNEILDNNAHAILKVQRYQISAINGERCLMFDRLKRPLDMLMPFVAAHVHHVDLAARRIDTSWPTKF